MLPDAPTTPVLGEPLLDARAVAAFLNVHISSIYRLAGAPNGLPVVEIGRSVRRFRPEDVRAYIASRTKSPQMAVEARELLVSIASSPVELPRLPGRSERPCDVTRGGSNHRPGGGR
ncbi:MAG: helix-turn-helix domain-containing protein [Planctomycetes bacterium]|nr:helix-turn-helix domain-containing protein [Planctomycetota bacterium]